MGRITEENIQDAMKEVKMALLEADVNFKVVRDFVKAVKEKALGAEVLKSLTPGQQFIKIVHDELVNLMGEADHKIRFASKGPTIIMMVGLQGSGKTTTCGKLAKFFKEQKKKPLLVACDIYRPAAVKQLQVLGHSLDIPVFTMGTAIPVVDIARAAMASADHADRDVIIFDTAGRLHIDEDLMMELEHLKAEIKPHEIFLVVDAMSGQDAVNVSKEFDSRLDITGAILTKLDGDARGGSALSVRAVTGKPIRYIGLGEKLDAIEPFHPDRMASRILGMGDVLTLIEKVEKNIDEDMARKMEEKFRKMEFNLEDFLAQMKQIRRLGPLQDILSMIPGIGSALPKDFKIDDKQIGRVEAMILSMTSVERKNPGVIDGSRRRRIAMGSGSTVADVNQLLKRFEDMQKMMKGMAGMQKKMRGMNIPGMGKLSEMMGAEGGEIDPSMMDMADGAESASDGPRIKGMTSKIKQKLKKKKRKKK
jgi:signal recognition particle subunit SRP54